MTFGCPNANRVRSSRSQQKARQRIRQPVLVFLGRPPTFAREHPVYIPPGKAPEDIPGCSVIKPRSEALRVAQRNNHRFLRSPKYSRKKDAESVDRATLRSTSK